MLFQEQNFEEQKKRIAEHKQVLTTLFKTPEKNAFIVSYISHRCEIPYDDMYQIGKETINSCLKNGVENFFFIDCIINSVCKETFYGPILDYLLKINKEKKIRIDSIVNHSVSVPAFLEFDHEWIFPISQYHFYRSLSKGANYFICSFTPQQQRQSTLISSIQRFNNQAMVFNVDYEYSKHQYEYIIKNIACGNQNIADLYFQVISYLSKPGEESLNELLLELKNEILRQQIDLILKESNLQEIFYKMFKVEINKFSNKHDD